MATRFIKYSYSIITKEGRCVPNVEDPIMPIDTNEEKKEAQARWKYLVECGFTANRKYEIIENTRHVVEAIYSPGGKHYTFEVDFTLKVGQAFEVEDIDNPMRTVFVVAVTTDHDETVESIQKRFPIQKLRKGKKPQYK